ncbi:MAG: ubiquinone-binding protein [Gammaproteobacteria bacterium]|nr:MAG: ubiquinone-binding protein [Gammaproteobacteria bacterium]
MMKVERSALVKHSAEKMYKLVDGVEDYPDFLPWCDGSRVIRRTTNETVGEINIARAGFHKTFSTQNHNIPHSRIELKLLDGPFSHLEGAWSFNALREDACKISLDMEFEFSNRLANIAFAKIFHHICSTMIESFCNRADEVYGR